MYRDQDGWIQAYKDKGALWIHDGNPRRPHALLTSGNHSNGFFNSRLIIPDEKLMREAASDLVDLLFLKDEFPETHLEIQGVVGPQTGATKLAEYVSDRIRAMGSESACFWVSPAKHEAGGVKSMVFNEEDLQILPNKVILPVEDVITTATSVTLAITAAIKAKAFILPFILVLVNRSGLTEVGADKIIALIDHAMPIWTPAECPLCKQGSKAIRPKDNWAELNAVYSN